MGAVAAEARLFFEFIKDDLGVRAFAVQLLDLPGIVALEHVGEVDGELMHVAISELPIAACRNLALRAASKDDSASLFPVVQMQRAIGHLPGHHVRRLLPMTLRHLLKGCAYVEGKLELEQVVGAVAFLLVPAHDRIVPQTEIATI